MQLILGHIGKDFLDLSLWSCKDGAQGPPKGGDTAHTIHAGQGYNVTWMCFPESSSQKGTEAHGIQGHLGPRSYKNTPLFVCQLEESRA